MPARFNTEKQTDKEEYYVREFVDLINPKIEELGYKITTQANLPYTNYCDKIDETGKGLDYPKGQKLYTTDALIYKPLPDENRIPLVVLEGKIRTQTTHDVITYTKKAADHKNVLPHLQYGFIVLKAKNKEFPDFYYQHAGFDFEEIFPENESPEQAQARIDKFIAELARQIEKAKEKHREFFKTEV